MRFFYYFIAAHRDSPYISNWSELKGIIGPLTFELRKNRDPQVKEFAIKIPFKSILYKDREEKMQTWLRALLTFKPVARLQLFPHDGRLICSWYPVPEKFAKQFATIGKSKLNRLPVPTRTDGT